MDVRRSVRTVLAPLTLVVCLGAAADGASAKGAFDKLAIYGDGSAIETSDSQLLAFDALNDFSAAYPGTPSVFNPGYLIMRYALDQRTGEYTAIDSFRFFPPDDIQPKAFVYYEGLVNGWSEYDAKWYEARPSAAQSLRAVIDGAASNSAGTTDGPPGTLVAGVAGLVIGVLGTLMVNSRRAGHRPTAKAAA